LRLLSRSDEAVLGSIMRRRSDSRSPSMPCVETCFDAAQAE
jgi:hypothetical protein